MSQHPAVIDFEQVSLTYPGPPAVTALMPCDLTVSRGEYVAVIGPSGSGKSTFLNVAGLLDRPTSGTYTLDGYDTGALTDAQRSSLRAHHIGFVFQSYHLLPQRSAIENVELAMLYLSFSREQRRTRAVDALIRVGLGHRVDAVAATLSGGEKQRVAIARAIVAEPTLLLCDEPTGNLDSVNAHAVLDNLEELHANGMTLVVITHDAGIASRAERTLRIIDGVVAAADSLVR